MGDTFNSAIKVCIGRSLVVRMLHYIPLFKCYHKDNKARSTNEYLYGNLYGIGNGNIFKNTIERKALFQIDPQLNQR